MAGFASIVVGVYFNGKDKTGIALYQRLIDTDLLREDQFRKYGKILSISEAQDLAPGVFTEEPSSPPYVLGYEVAHVSRGEAVSINEEVMRTAKEFFEPAKEALRRLGQANLADRVNVFLFSGEH
jgi:hypothetical protein